MTDSFDGDADGDADPGATEDAPFDARAPADALAAVADSALERALLDGTDARRYFALAGAVERARGDAADPESDPLTAALVCTVAVSALESARDPTWAPPDERTELVAAGAVRAVRRYDVRLERVAARAGLPLSDLRSRVSKEEFGDQR